MKTVILAILIFLSFVAHPSIAQSAQASGKTVEQGKSIPNKLNIKNKDLKQKKIDKNRKAKDREDRYSSDDDGYSDDYFKEDNGRKPNKEKRKNLNSVKDNNGNAYGRNKGNLSGRAFGQERARQARLQRDTKRRELASQIEILSQRTQAARERINQRLEELLGLRKRNSISEDQYNTRLEKIERVQEQIVTIKNLVRKAQNLTLRLSVN